MRFFETKNIPYEMVYDSKTEEEYTELYPMIPVLNELSEENDKLKRFLKTFHGIVYGQNCMAPEFKTTLDQLIKEI